METHENKKNDGKKFPHYSGLGIGVGLSMGIAFGAAFGNVGLGIALGIALGAGVEVTQMQRPKKDKEASE